MLGLSAWRRAMTADAWHWSAVIVGLLAGAALVAFGLLDGEQWATLAGGVLTGGTGVAGYRKVK